MIPAAFPAYPFSNRARLPGPVSPVLAPRRVFAGLALSSGGESAILAAAFLGGAGTL